MKSQALQQLVKEIFGNEEIKSQFIANPDSVLSRFSLTEEEKKAVLKTHAMMGQMTSGSAQLEITHPLVEWWV
jgi:hypothetical protein